MFEENIELRSNTVYSCLVQIRIAKALRGLKTCRGTYFKFLKAIYMCFNNHSFTSIFFNETSAKKKNFFYNTLMIKLQEDLEFLLEGSYR